MIGSVKKTRKPAKEPVEQKCSDDQAKIDQRLHGNLKKGLETCSRHQLQKIAKKHKVKTFQRKNEDIIKELRAKAKDLPAYEEKKKEEKK